MPKKDIFEPLPQPFNFAEAEKECIRFWKERQVYHQSLAQRKDAKRFVFYEGPPTANGMPHPGHCLTRTIKDIFPRYKTMDGYYCERKAGWDTHGLPVEVEVCKELGIIDGGKAAIESYGVEEFNRKCIESVFRYQKEWEELTDRIGFWVDLDQAYVTYHQSYVESVWWALKSLFDKGLLYQGHKVVWWWAQGGTALSAGEVGEGYRDTDDPAITVGFSLDEGSAKSLGIEAPVQLLVWTTTPWTLSSNCAACVGPEMEYAVVQHINEKGETRHYVLAAALVEKYFGESAVLLNTVQGSALIGLQYEPIFNYDHPDKIQSSEKSEKHWVIISGNFVDIETGTGIVHLAPAFGEDDYRVCKENNVGFLCFVKPDGTFDERVTDVDPYDKSPIAGQFCKDADKAIIRVLKEKGALLKHEQYRHPYPFCPRADKDPLIQYARKSWFIRTSQFVPDFLANNNKIKWQPEHIRDGRFGNFLENNVDWALSRERFWGTPLPVWICENTGHMECIASYDELLEKPDVQGLDVWENAKRATPELSEHLKVHKPYIDAITYQSPLDPEARMRRVPEVIDVWFDAGCMPFAQWGYPHQAGSAQLFKDRFPADFISEAIDQTRGWFYALLAISTIVHKDQDYAKEFPHPFRNCICLGHVLSGDGQKLSKRLKNYTEPRDMMNKYSADAMRWTFIAKNPPTNSSRMAEKLVEESQRELLIRWYNCFSFFVIYANLDGFDPSGAPVEFLRECASEEGAVEGGGGGGTAFVARENRAELDRWILIDLQVRINSIRDELNNYESYPAAREISAFVDSLSNWYVRRSRARFWASEWTEDKAAAYWTLYECLLQLARLAAPFVPFFSEYTWRHLSAILPNAAESVHLARYPQEDYWVASGDPQIGKSDDLTLLIQMGMTREAVSLGLSARRAENIKVRQPLSRCTLVMSRPEQQNLIEKHIDLIMDELNVKTVDFTQTPEHFVSYVVKPNFKTLGPKFGKQVKAIGKVLEEGDGADWYAKLQRGAIQIEVEGIACELSSEDVEVRLIPRDGFAAAQGIEMVVVLSTEITPELKQEGLVRELVHVVQNIRKEMNLAYDARIEVSISTEAPELREVITTFADTISAEVLAKSLNLVESLDDGATTHLVEGKELRVAVV